MRYLLLKCALITFVSISSFAADSYEPDDNNNALELGIGDKAPNFKLMDQYGHSVQLEELLGKNGALLNFYRSASW